MDKARIKPSSIFITIIVLVLLFKCARSMSDAHKRAMKDPRVQERIEQEREDLKYRLLDKHFEEDARKKR